MAFREGAKALRERGALTFIVRSITASEGSVIGQ
jgi:hypothetical protein